MTWVLLLLAAAALQAPKQPAPPAQASYAQSYSIYIRNEFAGTERVAESIDPDGNFVSTSLHELQISGGNDVNRMAFETTMTRAKGTDMPTEFRLQYTSGPSGDYCEVKVRNARISRVLSRGGKTSEVEQAAGPDTFIFDFNVYHQFDYLARRYDARKGGRQVLRSFIPIIGAEIPLALTFLEASDLDYGRGKIAVRNFRFELTGVMIGAFSIDKDNRLVRLVVHDKDLEVLRQDIAPQ